MPLHIVRNDITLMQCDAIVNPTNTMLYATGGTDARIHEAAGPELDAACEALGSCAVGEAKCTPGYRLPVRYIFHTVGPMWVDGTHGEPEQLAACYRACLALAGEYHCASVAFPIISAGTFGFPKDLALEIANRELSRYLLQHDLEVYLVIYDREIFRIGQRLFSDIRSYLDGHYEESVQTNAGYFQRPPAPMMSQSFKEAGAAPAAARPRRKPRLAKPDAAPAPSMSIAPDAAFGAFICEDSLEDRLAHLDESFSQMLLRLIDERGMKDSECYKRANIDRKLFSKIRNDLHYNPKKTTALAFAIALELSMDETRDLLQKAGYALSPASKFDVIIEYFIQSRNYNIFEINETLFYFDQALLGA